MKTKIEIVGTARTKLAEEWNLGLIDLAVQAGGAALDSCNSSCPSAIVVGNALGAALDDQRNLAVYIASRLGLGNIESHSISCDEASGGAAFRLATSLISAGFHESVLVVGAEKTSDALPDQLEAARATGLDAMKEAAFGFGPAVASGMGMQRYLLQHSIDRDMFFYTAETAHYHAAANPLAFFPWKLSIEQYRKSPVVAYPLTVCDNAPMCDGAAAVLIRKAPAGSSHIQLLGSSSISSPAGIGGPIESLTLPASKNSAGEALSQSGLTLEEISLFELHDSSAFLGALSIESIGLAKPGTALHCAQDGQFKKEGKTPLWTFGGLKARGNAPGASGVYQIAEAIAQLEGTTEASQIKGAKSALVQCLGSFGAQAVTHIFG